MHTLPSTEKQFSAQPIANSTTLIFVAYWAAATLSDNQKRKTGYQSPIRRAFWFEI